MYFVDVSVSYTIFTNILLVNILILIGGGIVVKNIIDKIVKAVSVDSARLPLMRCQLGLCIRKKNHSQ